MLDRFSHRHVAKKLFRPWGERRFAANINDPSNPEYNPGNLEGGAEGIPLPESGTQSEVAEALQTPESIQERARDAYERTKDIIKTVEHQINHGDLRENKADVISWHKSMEAKLFVLKNLLDKQREWEQGILEPQAYVDSINEFIKATHGQANRITLDPEHDYRAAYWVQMPVDDRRRIQEQVEESLLGQGIGNPTKDAETLIDEVEAELKEKEPKLQEYVSGTKDKDESAQDTSLGLLGGLKAGLDQVQFKSIMDYVRAGKKYYEGLQSAWEKRANRVSAGIAESVGSALSFIPLGNEVHTELSTAREQTNEEEKNAQKESLEKSNTVFLKVIEILSQQRGNANKFNGTMEYMADHGWLYEFNIESGKLFGIPIPTPEGWSAEAKQEHLIRMQSANSSGQENQKKRMTDLIGTASDIEPIATYLQDELENYNYWGAYAALEVAMEKGKIGESGTWITTIFLSHLRKNTEARKYIPIDLFDQLGNLGITHPAWTPTFMKTNRKDLEAWQQSDNPERFRFGGNLAKAITMVEEEVREKFGSTDAEVQAKLGSNMTFDRVVARVLSAQVVSHGKDSVSIFSSRYTSYRQVILNTDTTIQVDQADDDFYGKISDAHLIGIGGMRSIFNMTTQGGFQHLTKANSYITNMLKLDDKLQQSGDTDALENYRKEMRKKLEQYFVEDVKRHDPTIRGWETRSLDGKLIVKEFVDRNMLSQAVLDDAFRGSK